MEPKWGQVNADHDGDRYLIFGVKDRTKEIIGVNNDPNRKNLQNIIDLIRSSHFNNLPTISLETFKIDNLESDILTIKNKKKRPYYLLQDKREEQTTVRAGVIYTRDGDSNTPLTSTADTAKINDMWREHFGLNLTPFERFKIYIHEKDMWLKQPFPEDKAVYYYKQFPEFTIHKINTEDYIQKSLDWYNYKPAIQSYILLTYYNTVLLQRLFYTLDKECCFFPFLDSSRSHISDIFPEKKSELIDKNWSFENEFFFTLKDDISYDIYNLFRHIYNFKKIEEFSTGCFAKKPIYVFNNLEEAKNRIKELGIGKIGISKNA